ncbi:taste receptor, type 2, member 203 [Misgurnus anguillicaudatus]|uniref:taste receptor, type 2, member 203 n=1 Tax=Misgurnus anguillicaudatus TaxID=75329 RepID=UPI003CCF0CCF
MMQPWLFVLICSPFCLASSVVNIFFFSWLIRPAAGVTVRYPMRFLLITVLCNSAFLQIVTAVIMINTVVIPPFWFHTVTRVLIYQGFTGNFSCNAWISIFYHVSIVPQHRAILVWIKRHITGVIYVGFTSTQVLLIFSLTLGTITFLMDTDATSINSTINTLNTSSLHQPKELKFFQLSNLLYVLYCTCPLITLSVSWGKTFVYLRGHMKQMGQNESFSQSQQKSQMRVTVIGMIQAAVFLPSSLWTVVAAFLYVFNLFDVVDPSRYITISFCAVSNLGNLLCFGFSQSVFRVRIVSLLRKLKRNKEDS